MADLASLQVSLELQTAQFTEQMGKVNSELDRMNKKVDGVSSTFSALGKTLAGAFTVGTLISAFRNATDAMDQMAKSAQKLGIPVEELSALKFAAESSGVPFASLNTALKTLSKNLADVDKGTSSAAKAMRELGIKSTDTTTEALKKLAKAFEAAPDNAQKTAVALAALGKSGADLIPFLNQGAEGIDEMTKKAERLGQVIDGTTAKQAEKFNDALGDMGFAINGIVKNVTAGMLPAFSSLADNLVDSAKAGEGWKKVGEGIGEVLIFLAKMAVEVAGAFQDIGIFIAGVGAATAAFFSGNFAGAAEILRAMDEDTQKLASSIESRKKMLDDMNKGLGETAEVAKKTTSETGKLGNAFKAMGEHAEKTHKKVKDLTQLALTPAQQILIDLNKLAETRLAALDQLTELSKLSPEAFLELTKGVVTMAEAQERLKKSAGIWTDFDQAVANVTAHKKDLDDFAASWVKLIDQLNSEAISPERFAEIAEELKKLDPALKDANKEADDFSKIMDKLGKDITGAIAENASNAVNDLIDSFGKAKFSFSDLATSILKDIAKMITQLLIMKPLMDSIKNSSIFAGMGFAKGGAFSSSLGLPYGVYTTPTRFGIPGGGPLKAYAKGGLFAENGPEAILPLQRNAQGQLGVAGSGVEVNVFNNAPVDVSTKESQGADGQTILDLYIDRRINERFSNGSMDKVMRNNFGVMRSAVG